jgi:hypothetical protein
MSSDRRSKRCVTGHADAGCLSPSTPAQPVVWTKTGTGDEVRTHDPSLGKVALVVQGAPCFPCNPPLPLPSARNAITGNEVCAWYLREAGEGRLLGRNRRPLERTTGPA